MFIYSYLAQTNQFKRKLLRGLLFFGGAFWWSAPCYNRCSHCHAFYFEDRRAKSRVLLLIKLMPFQGSEKPGDLALQILRLQHVSGLLLKQAKLHCTGASTVDTLAVDNGVIQRVKQS